jgi:hypothetical protein
MSTQTTEQIKKDIAGARTDEDEARRRVETLKAALKVVEEQEKKLPLAYIANCPKGDPGNQKRLVIRITPDIRRRVADPDAEYINLTPFGVVVDPGDSKSYMERCYTISQVIFE